MMMRLPIFVLILMALPCLVMSTDDEGEAELGCKFEYSLYDTLFPASVIPVGIDYTFAADNAGLNFIITMDPGTAATVRTWKRSGVTSTWSMTQNITTNNAATACWGCNFAIDSLNELAIAGGSNKNLELWSYYSNSGLFELLYTIAHPDTAHGTNYFGEGAGNNNGVYIDGEIIVACDYGLLTFTGACYSFTKIGPRYTYTQTLTAPVQVVGQQYGYSFSVYDGVSMVITSVNTATSGNGTAYYYKLVDSFWQLMQTITQVAVGKGFGTYASIGSTFLTVNDNDNLYVYDQGDSASYTLVQTIKSNVSDIPYALPTIVLGYTLIASDYTYNTGVGAIDIYEWDDDGDAFALMQHINAPNKTGQFSKFGIETSAVSEKCFITMAYSNSTSPVGSQVYIYCISSGNCLGCDGVENSGLVHDICGLCGGDGSTCSNSTVHTPFDTFDNKNNNAITVGLSVLLATSGFIAVSIIGSGYMGGVQSI